MTRAEFITDRRATAAHLRTAAGSEGRIAAQWLQSRDGRTRRRAVRAARDAAHYFGLALRFDAAADAAEEGASAC